MQRITSIQTPEARSPALKPSAPARLTFLCTLALAIGLSGLPRQAAAQCDLTVLQNGGTVEPAAGTNLYSAAISGNTMYMHTQDLNDTFDYFLAAVDITNPANPVFIGASPGSATPFLDDSIGSHVGTESVALGTLFIGIRNGNIQIYEMADPNNPVALGSFDLPESVKGLELGGNTLFALSGGRLDAVDVSDPFNPQSIDSVPLTSAKALGTPRGGILPLTANDELQLIDVSDSSNLVVLDTISGTALLNPTIVGNAVVITSHAGSLRVFDITDPANIAPLPSFPDPNFDTQFQSNYTLTGRASGFVYYGIAELMNPGKTVAIDFTNPSSPVVVDEVLRNEQDVSNDVLLVGSRLVALQYFLYRVFDVSSCATPPSITTHPFCQATNEGGAPVVLNTITSNGTAFEWIKDGQVVSNGPIYSGANTDTLTIQPVVEASGSYELTVSNGDGEVTSLPAVVAVAPNAPAPTGGCTFSGEICVVLTNVDCQSAGGTYLGDDTDCSIFVPDPTGACTFAGDECIEFTDSACLIAGGTYLGDDTDCSFTLPTITNITRGTTHPTLNDAIFCSNRNDIIEIGEGRLVEWGLLLSDHNITIRGQGRDATIIDAAYNGRVFRMQDGDESTIEDLTIRRGVPVQANGGGAAHVANAKVTFHRVDIRECDGTGFGVGAVCTDNSSAVVLFDRCRFIDNINGGVASVFGGGGSASSTFINCLFLRNGGANHTLYTRSADTLVNCTFADNTDGWAIREASGVTNIHNCIFDSSNPSGSLINISSVDYSLLPGGTGTNIDGVPTFVDAANGDYRLAAGSLGIDAADYDFYNNVVVGEGAFDVYGDDRLYNDTEVADTGVGAFTYLDMGASEYRPEMTGPNLCLGDMNEDGAIDGLDAQLFVEALLAGTTCP